MSETTQKHVFSSATHQIIRGVRRGGELDALHELGAGLAAREVVHVGVQHHRPQRHHLWGTEGVKCGWKIWSGLRGWQVCWKLGFYGTTHRCKTYRGGLWPGKCVVIAQSVDLSRHASVFLQIVGLSHPPQNFIRWQIWVVRASTAGAGSTRGARSGQIRSSCVLLGGGWSVVACILQR